MSKLPGRENREAALRLRIGGRVQGVGFRPFVYRLAKRHGLVGEVRNRSGEVEVLVQGAAVAVEAFSAEVLVAAPPLARPHLLERAPQPLRALSDFTIDASSTGGEPRLEVPPDYFACDDCLAEVRDPHSRRYGYPFTNCTQCGPRYTLIVRLPYDRPNTTMAGFALCEACRREYENPADRRFHAQPIACPVCGPGLTFEAEAETNIDTAAALNGAVDALRQGLIVAVKGVGGYHLLCDARNEQSVQQLRRNKPRPHKPLAVLFPWGGNDGVAEVSRELQTGQAERACLASPARPIVLCPKRPDSTLAPGIAPGLAEVGAMLPYSPLHYLLAEQFGGPLVATSGNMAGEPVFTTAEQARARLSKVAGAMLHHDRPILRPADDSIYRTVAGQPLPLRLGRGHAPLEIPLPALLTHPTLAVGGHMKNTIALGWGDRAVVSPHIGDLDSPRARDIFEQVIEAFQALYGIKAEQVVCDAHPGYAATRWASASGLKLRRVYHHHAHAGALYGEHTGAGRWLVFTWDGLGLGEDGTLWGGEALLGSPGHWRRIARIRPFRLPGGDRAAREPWRSALGLLWESGREWDRAPEEAGLLQLAWSRGMNAPVTSSVGRVFDAAAALLDLCRRASFEGQGPMLVEAAANREVAPLALPLRENPEGFWTADWEPLLALLQDETKPVAVRAGALHSTLAKLTADLAVQVRRCQGPVEVGLTGGVFQNRLLSEQAKAALEEAGFRVHLPLQIPGNDGGLCYGQLVEAAASAN